jgi:hypothetical protein
VITTAPQKTLAFAWCGDCSVYLSTANPPTDTDWAEYIKWCKETPTGKSGKQKVLVFERGPGPNAAQRRMLHELLEDVDVRVAVVTASPIARGVMTALSWFAKKQVYRAFAPTDLSKAFEYLSLDAKTAVEVRAAIDGTSTGSE